MDILRSLKSWDRETGAERAQGGFPFPEESRLPNILGSRSASIRGRKMKKGKRKRKENDLILKGIMNKSSQADEGKSPPQKNLGGGERVKEIGVRTGG